MHVHLLQSQAKLFTDDGMGARQWRSEYKGRFDNKWTDEDDEDLSKLSGCTRD